MILSYSITTWEAVATAHRLKLPESISYQQGVKVVECQWGCKLDTRDRLVHIKWFCGALKYPFSTINVISYDIAPIGIYDILQGLDPRISKEIGYGDSLPGIR